MKITTEHGKGTKIHIFIDGEYKMTVDSDYWYSQGICSGDEIDEEQLIALEGAISFRRAFNSGLDYLSRRSHSKKELCDKLTKKVDRKTAQAVVEKIESLGFLDDTLYAEDMAKDMFERKGFAPQRIICELNMRGISKEIAENAVEKLDFDESMRIIELIEKKFIRKMSDEKGRRQVFANLMRMGYKCDAIKSAFSEFNYED